MCGPARASCSIRSPRAKRGRRAARRPRCSKPLPRRHSPMSESLTVVFLDNFDSFTYNLVDEFARRGTEVVVFRNDVPASRVVAEATAGGRRLLVISPGPGTPDAAGSCLDV